VMTRSCQRPDRQESRRHGRKRMDVDVAAVWSLPVPEVPDALDQP
jgi:hypothetical protein